MISMKEVMNLLTDCELAQLIYVDTDSRQVNQAMLPTLARSINMGVLELHKRFTLKKGKLQLSVNPGVHRYYLRPERLMTATGTQDKYIISEDLITNRSLLKVEEVYDQQGRELYLNSSERFGVMTPAADIIEVPDFVLKDCKVNMLDISFRMAPKNQILSEDFIEDVDCLKVDIPYTHLQALIWYVASRSHASKGFQENTASEFVSYGNRYEQECANLEALNFRVDQQGGTDRLNRQGWA